MALSGKVFSPCYLGIGSIFVIKGNIQNIIRVNELIYKMGNSRWCFFPYNSVKEVPCCESRWCSLMWLGLSWPLNKRSCTWSTLIAPLPVSQHFLVSHSCNAGWVHVMPMDNRSLFMWRCCKNELRVSCLSRWATGEYGKWVIWTLGRWKNPVTIFDHLHTCYLPEILVVRYTLWHDDHLIRFSFSNYSLQAFFFVDLSNGS